MRRIIYIAVIVVFAIASKACDCVGPNNFLESIGSTSIVFRGEIIETVRYNGSQEQVLTTVKVLEEMKGKVKTDTILILQGSSGTCMGMLLDTAQRAQLVISGVYSEIYIGYELGPIFVDGLEISSCGVHSLVVNQSKVQGIITKDNYARDMKARQWLLKYSPLRFLSEDRKRKLHVMDCDKNYSQVMSISKFRRLLADWRSKK